MVNLHLLTRCTNVQNLNLIKESIYPTINFNVVWHIIFDASKLKDLDVELLSELQGWGAKFYFKTFQSSHGVYTPFNEIIETLDDGFVGILHDNNLVYPTFYSELYMEILRNQTKQVFVYEQKLDKKDFTGLDVRPIGPEYTKAGHIDSAQYVIHTSLYKTFKYEDTFDADGRLVETIYKEHPQTFHYIKKVMCYYNEITKTRTSNVPKVLYIGEDTPTLETIRHLDYQDISLNVRYDRTDSMLHEHLVEFNPDVILTKSDNPEKFTELVNSQTDIKKKWLNVNTNTVALGEYAYNHAMEQMLINNTDYLVSYFTPIYNTKKKLLIAYESLKNQTNDNWEWVLVNDSSDGGETLKIAEIIAAQDHRVKVYDFREKTNGIIGESKYRAACLTRGKWLAELDHDDMLTETCTQDILDAATKFPDAGFIYTDFVEVNEQLNSLMYGPGFALGYGKYTKVKYKTFEWDMCITPNINPKTIRHIVGVPNHVRVWRRDVYFTVGGHNRYLSVADDYELIVRTFLETKFVKIPKLGYIQFIYNNQSGQNTHDLARADIQRRVRTIAQHYSEQIKDRFNALGVHDYVYEENKENPLAVQSRFGENEGYVNYIF